MLSLLKAVYSPYMPKQIFQKIWFKPLIYCGVFLLGMAVMYGIKFFSPTGDSATDQASEQHSGGYTYINPLIACNDLENTSNRELIELDGELTQYITDQKLAGNVSYVSVYYRDLNNGPWFGIRATKKFFPASLLKVPLMIAYLKAADQYPRILQQEIQFVGSSTPGRQYVVPSVQIEPGKTYTVDQLVQSMIRYSDNNAAELLVTAMQKDHRDKVYLDLGLHVPDDGSDYPVDSKTYASFFRILYNASYLSKQLSEQALKLLAASEFKDGIVAGVPSGIPVAHKFGERFGEAQSQFHDCGIVYYPNRPYLLCVMTSGDDFTKQIPAIAQISRIVYQKIDENRKK